jgi:hypothetical protein
MLLNRVRPQGSIKRACSQPRFPEDKHSNITLQTIINRRTTSVSSENMVHTQKFGDMQVPVPGFGAMGISFGLGNNLTLEQAEPVLLKALELGCTFWDTAVSMCRIPSIV